MHLETDAAQAWGVQEMMGQSVGFLDGLSDADRDNRFYWKYSAASDVGGHVSVRGLARIFVRRRNLQVFTSKADAATISVLLIDPKLTSGARRARFGPGLWPGSRRQACRAGQDSGVNGEP